MLKKGESGLFEINRVPHQQKLNEQQWGISLAISKKNKKNIQQETIEKFSP